MSKEMLINVSEGEECRIALVEDGRLEELYMERTSSTSHVGNVYKGKVTNVEPSIQAAFVDFGLGRNGFLHISDLMPTYFGGKAEDVVESVGRKMARRDRPPIQRCLRRGDEIIVQIIKEGIGTKGPTLSTYVSIPGRILVMMPGMSKLGVSRKIEDEEERKRLRQILDGLKPPKECGFIIRTAGVGKSKAEIERDLKYLTRLYENINKKAKATSGPTELYAEGDLVTRTVRDVMTSDVERIVVDNDDVAKKIKEFFKLVAPRTKNKVDLYEDPVPLFHKYGIEKEIELMYSRHVPLPSGGSLVIDSTEAIVAIDVNSGKFREHADAETTAFKTDMEAADEIPRQLRLRDLGGVIICDFIDLRFERHRRDLEKRLHDNLNRDRAKTKMLRMSQFGIIEMTRQRMRPSLKRSIYNDCPHCHGSGQVKTPESMSLDVMRRLAIASHDDRVARIELAVCNEVSYYLQNKKRAQLAHLEEESGKLIIIRTDPQLALDDHRLELFDGRDGLVFLSELGMTPADQQQQQGGGRGGRGGQHQGRGRDRDQQRGGRGERGGDDRGGRDQQRGGRGERGERGGDDRADRGGRRDQRDQRGGGGGGQQGRGGRDRGRNREDDRSRDQHDVESMEDQVDERESDREDQADADLALDAPLPPPQEVVGETDDDEREEASVPAAAYEDEGESDDLEEAPAEVDDSDERAEELVAQHASSGSDDDDDDGADQDSGEDDDAPRRREQPVTQQQSQPAAPPPPPQGGSYYDEYEEEIELQPRGITHERPTLKELKGGRGGRGGRGQQGGRRGGRGGRGGPVQPKIDLGPPVPKPEGEMSLAERFAMELAAEKAARRGQQGGGGGGGNQGQGGQGGGGGHRQQQPQGGGHRQQHGGGGGGGHRQQQQPQGGHRQQQQHRTQGGGRPQHQGGGGGGGGGGGQNRPQHQQHRQGGGHGGGGGGGGQGHAQGGQQRHDGGQRQGGGGQGEGEGGGRRGRRRRRGRGGRGSGGGGGNEGGNQAGGGFANGEASSAGSESSRGGGDEQLETRSQQSSQQPSETPRPPVQRTGSTDRHLLNDQPVMPQPISRPRTYRDLDEIPDDLD